MNDIELDGLFAAAKTQPTVSQDLQARVLADAGQVMAGFAPVPAASRRPSLWKMALAAVGGWAAMASMATAAVTGLWFGMASPESVGGYLGTSGTVSSYSLGDLMPALDVLAEEG